MNTPPHNSLAQLRASMQAILDRRAMTLLNGRPASERTKRIYWEVLMECCDRLHVLGLQLSDANNVGERHIAALVQDWHARGLTPKTMQNKLSRLRIFGVWIGKPSLVKPIGNYLPHVDAGELKVSAITTRSKSWSEAGIDVTVKIREAGAIDARFGAMVGMGFAFGLRNKELLRIMPHRADKGSFLVIDGNIAKSGRYREVPIEHPFQREMLERAKRVCKLREMLGWPGQTYEFNRQRYQKFMRNIGISKVQAGVTGHGMRAEFAETLL